MKIGITGASGHIGNNLVRELIRTGYEVRVLVHRDVTALRGLDVEIFKGDVCSPDEVESFTNGLEVVYHLAARIFIRKYRSRQFFGENVTGTENIIRSCIRHHCRLIHFSSIHAFNPHPADRVLNEGNDLVVHDKYYYNRSKALTHKMVLDATRKNGLQGVVLCPTAVLGPNDFKPSLLGGAVLRMIQGRMPALVPGGYNWVDVRDVVHAAVSVATSQISGEDFLLAGKWLSLPALYSTIRQYVPGLRKLPVIPGWLAAFGAPFLEFWSLINGREPLYTRDSMAFLNHSHRNISADKARRMLGYSSRPIEETIRDTVGWFQNVAPKKNEDE